MSEDSRRDFATLRGAASFATFAHQVKINRAQRSVSLILRHHHRHHHQHQHLRRHLHRQAAMPGTQLKHASAVISVVAETALMSHYWVLSQPNPPQHWPQRYCVSAIMTTSLYALAEPALTILTLWTPVPQKFLLIVIGAVHLLVAGCAMHIVSESIRFEPSAWHKTSHEQAPGGITPNEKASAGSAEIPSGLDAVRVFSLTRCQAMVANFLPVLTAAWCNAGLFLFTHSLRASYTRVTPYRVTDECFEWLAIVTYMLSVLLSDHAISTIAFRRHPAQSRTTILSGLGHLLLLGTLRTCVRLLCGMSPSASLTAIYDSQFADHWFDPSRYERITSIAQNFPLVFLLLVPLVLSQSSFLFNYIFIYRPAHNRLERLERMVESGGVTQQLTAGRGE